MKRPAAETPAAVLDHLRAGRVRPGGGHGSAESLAHSVGALATSAMLERGIITMPDSMRGILGDVLQRSMPGTSGTAAGGGGGVSGQWMAGVRRDRRLVRRYRRLSRAPEGQARSHARLRLATGWIHGEMMRRLCAVGGRAAGRAGFGLRAEAAVGALLSVAPYLLASRYVAGEERFARTIHEEFFGPPTLPDAHVPAVMLTDTFTQLNGVAGTMRRLARYAEANPDRRIRVITCEGRSGETPGLLDLAPVARVPVPGYDDGDLRPGHFAVISELSLPPRQALEGIETRRVTTVKRGDLTETRRQTVTVPATAPAPAAPVATLTYADQDGPHVFAMEKDRIVIGRGGVGYWVDVKLHAAPDVSREHLRIRRDPQSGAFFVKDLSSFGTTLDGVPVPKSVEVVGDQKRDHDIEVPLPERARLVLAGLVTIEFQRTPPRR